MPSRRHDGHVVEESLRKLLGLAVADRVWARTSAEPPTFFDVRGYAAIRLSARPKYVGGLVRIAITVGDPPGLGPITRDVDDDYLIRLARAAGADAVISGDRDPLDADIPDVVLTPAKLVARMSQH